MEHLWWRKATPHLLLRLAAHIYAGISARHLARRKRHAVSPAIPLVSVGNITVGGSGKTPFVVWLCKQLQQHGYKPVILCRGDGGGLNQPRLINEKDDANLVGDEALLLAHSCHAPVIAGRDRVAASVMAQGMGDIIILDDGFQYRQLKRACDIVLVPSEGAGNGCLLPAGPLREPISALARADLIVRTGDGPATPVTQAKEWRWRAHSSCFRQIRGADASTPEKVMAVCGIARPQRFLASLDQQGMTVEDQMIFPDHYRYRSSDIERMTAKGLPVVTTGKDAVKLAAIWPEDLPLWVLPLEGEGEEGLPEAIVQTILGT
ncbi:MAG: tetraacyldisaccharide 4'-kinase [Mariprofundaceae bacterium]|nr:tetraacyldisaccharide 4'-kinase [Mariprofundaceae bacterium]